MRAAIKRERELNKAMQFLSKIGVATEDIETTTAEILDTMMETRERQGEAALLFLDTPARFLTKKCAWRECGEFFGTSYKSNAYCSNACRGKDFFDKTGTRVDWGAKSMQERWGGEPPLVIDPVTLKFLAQHYQELRDSQSPTSIAQTRQEIPQPVTSIVDDEALMSEMTHTNNPPTNPLDALAEPTLQDLLDLDFDAEFL